MVKDKLPGIFAILLFLIQVSCVQKYWPDLGSKYDELLVVEGTITNNPGPYTVKLSLSSSLDLPNWLAYSGCDVAIVCDDGTVEYLMEQEAGTYLSSPNGMVGEIGKKYKINITTPAEKTYESAFELLRKPVELDTVYAEVTSLPSGGLPHQLEGYRFYLDTKPAEKDTNYLFWKLQSTFKYRADFLTRYVYDDHHLIVFPKADSLQTCWRTNKIPSLFLYQTAQLDEPVIRRFPLNFVSTEGRELAIRYSLLVSQLTISSDAYTYWDGLRKQNDNQESLYTMQPYQIQGNVKNVYKPDEPVLGYFTVAGVSERRIFVGRPPLWFHYSVCVLDEGDYEAMGMLKYTDERSWPIYITSGPGYGLAFPNQECIDCRLSGGTIVKPDFWKDEWD